ncbi:MAG: OmpA family protein [Marinilabiliales bacterium]|nr:OmpA family protein [Marinilabiliales bacterium]
MKKFHLLAFIPLIALLSSSCATVYRCGETRPAKQPVTWSKQLKSVVNERDVLCINLAAKEKENTELKNNLADLSEKKTELDGQYASLSGRYAELDAKYNNLIDEKLSEAEQFNRTLKAKSDELAGKEMLLSERERALHEMQKVIARQDSITRLLNSTLRNALLGFNSDELSVEIKNGKVYVSMSDKLLFKSGSSTVEEKGREALSLLGSVLNKNMDIDILVEGHTDNVPIKTAVFKDNWDLSVARATSIVRILTNDYKVAPTRITASGKGEFLPRASNDTTEGRARNRRTEIILSPKLDELMELLAN